MKAVLYVPFYACRVLFPVTILAQNGSFNAESREKTKGNYVRNKGKD